MNADGGERFSMIKFYECILHSFSFYIIIKFYLNLNFLKQLENDKLKKLFAPPTQWCFGLSSFVVLIVNPFFSGIFLEFQKTIFHQIFRKNVTPLV